LELALDLRIKAVVVSFHPQKGSPKNTVLLTAEKDHIHHHPSENAGIARKGWRGVQTMPRFFCGFDIVSAHTCTYMYRGQHRVTMDPQKRLISPKK